MYNPVRYGTGTAKNTFSGLGYLDINLCRLDPLSQVALPARQDPV